MLYHDIYYTQQPFLHYVNTMMMVMTVVVEVYYNNKGDFFIIQYAYFSCALSSQLCI